MLTVGQLTASRLFCFFGLYTVSSQEGAQQGVPIGVGPLVFCNTIHPMLSSLQAKLNLGYLRVGHGLDSSTDWIGLDWVGLDWVQFLGKKLDCIGLDQKYSLINL